MASINLNTGKKTIDIIKDGKNVGVIEFSPADPYLVKRIKEANETIKTINANIHADSTVEQALEETERIEKQIREAIDYAFDYPCSDVVFGNSCSMCSASGTSQLEQFLNGAMKIIDEEMTKEAKEASKRQAKYLDKYKKK